MFMMAFFSWWYKEGWTQVAFNIPKRLNSVTAAFSVNQLLSTLFAPWRRIITYPGASLSDKFRAWGDNLFSRTIGFFVRLLVLLAAFFVIIAVIIISLIEFVVWPLLPIGIFGGTIAGLIW